MIYLNRQDNDKQFLKCIGGVFDGQWRLVPEYLKIGDSFRIQEEFKLECSTIPTSFDEKVLNVTINYYAYRICVFHFNKDEAYKFLVFHEMSDKEALLSLFNK